MSFNPPILRLALESSASRNEIHKKLLNIWPNEFALEYVDASKFILSGPRGKFRHVIMSRT